MSSEVVAYPNVVSIGKHIKDLVKTTRQTESINSVNINQSNFGKSPAKRRNRLKTRTEAVNYVVSYTCTYT